MSGVSQRRPLGDHTNTTNSLIENSRNKREASIKGVTSLSELVPPLNAARLRPIQQKTRTASVSCVWCVLAPVNTSFLIVLGWHHGHWSGGDKVLQATCSLN